MPLTMLRRGAQRSGRKYPLVLLAWFFAVAHVASFATNKPIVTDIRFYLYFAAQTAQGAVPYLDFFDLKTPLATFAGALFYRLGDALGVEPLVAIRVGYLGLAATAGVLLFSIHRRLAGGRYMPGFLALFTYLGFALLGALPAIGNIPKMLTALFASLAALLAGDRRWLLAGVAAWLAFMDWQIGILALGGVFGAALCDVENRLRCLGRAALGALLGATPFLLYFGAHGALDETYRQIVRASFARGEGSLTPVGLVERSRHLLEVIEIGCRGHEWLVVLGVVGMLIYPFWIRRQTRRPTLHLAVALAIYHYGLVAFSLVDFQYYGDLFILLHSVAFFAAITLIEVFIRFSTLALRRSRALGTTARPVWYVVVQATVLLATLTLARPSVLRPDFSLAILPEATLDDQREVARRLQVLIGGKRAAFIGPLELLFIAEKEATLALVHWDAATYAYHRAGPGERSPVTLRRILRETQVEAIVLDNHSPVARWFGEGIKESTLTSASGAYSVRVFFPLQTVSP